LYPRSQGITGGFCENDTENTETSRQVEDDLLQEQEGKGYGEDEGERDDALADEDEQ